MVAFSDGPEEFEVGPTEDAAERFEILDRQRCLAGFNGFAVVDRVKLFLEVATI